MYWKMNFFGILAHFLMLKLNMLTDILMKMHISLSSVNDSHWL